MLRSIADASGHVRWLARTCGRLCTGRAHCGAGRGRGVEVVSPVVAAATASRLRNTPGKRKGSPGAKPISAGGGSAHVWVSCVLRQAMPAVKAGRYGHVSHTRQRCAVATALASLDRRAESNTRQRSVTPTQHAPTGQTREPCRTAVRDRWQRRRTP
eukprot:4236182-Pleurochrysis_carterae.AAC.1